MGLLDILRADLRNAFPDLDVRPVLKRARVDLLDRRDHKIKVEGPAVRLRWSGEPLVDPRSAPEPPAASSCIPPEARTEGWFTSHAFRIARVHDEIRRLRVALGNRSAERVDCLGHAIRLVIERTSEPGRIDDHFHNAFARVLKQSGQYDCERDFCPWFLEILYHCIVDEHRQPKQPSIDPARDPDWEADKPPVDVHGLLVSEWFESVIEGFVEHRIPIPAEQFMVPARLELERLGIKAPSEEIVSRWADYLRRLFEKRFSRPDPGGPEDEVPLNQYELFVAYGTHRDLRRELDPGDAARVELIRVEKGIEALIEYQEKKDRGEGEWVGSPRGGPVGPVEQLACEQTRVWGLLAGRSDTDVVWKAARNLYWFSWRMKAAATLSAALRYALRRNEPTLGPLVEALRPLECLRTFPQGVQRVLSPLQGDVAGLPAGDHADAPAVDRLLWTALRRASLGTRHPDAVRIDAELPEVDWRWWISRVTGRGRDRADGLARGFPGPDGIGPQSPDRS